MNLDSIKKNIETFGAYNLFLHLIFKTLKNFTYFNILVGMTLDEESLDPKFLDLVPKYSARFLSNSEIYQYSEDAENDLPKSFVDQALKNSDLCFAILEGDKLASYGWYTNQEATFNPELKLHFNRDWIYMYRGYTLPAYRGQRLHAVGMARAMKSFIENGYKGIISYVEASNFSSLRSVFRMGYIQIGRIFIIKLFGKYLSWTTGSCRRYSLKLIPQNSPSNEVAAVEALQN